MMATDRPGVLDYLDLWALRLVKARRQKFADDSGFYDTFFEAGDVEKYLGDVRNSVRLARVAEVYRTLFGAGSARVADVGCGLGVVLRFLPPGADYVGIEYSGHSLALARGAHPGRKARFEQGGFPHLPLEAASVDLAICLEVVEHVADDRTAFEELARVVRPGGHLLVSVPGHYYWPDYMRLIGHYRHYRGDGLARLLAESGFRVVRRFPQFHGFWRVYHYFYLVLKAVEMVVRRLGARDFSILATPFYRAIARRIEAALARRGQADDRDSTYVLARREPPPAA